MADSVIVILVNQEEIKVLYTEKFQLGDLKHLEDNRIMTSEDLHVNRAFKETVSGTKASELETGYKIRDIKKGFVSYRASDMMLADGTYPVAQVINFNNTITHYKKNIIFVC